MATHSSVLAWRIPGMGEPVGRCLWGCTELDTTEATQQQQQQQQQRSLRLSSALFILFYFILLFRSYFHHFIFQLTDQFFCFRFLLLIPSRVFLISVIVLFLFVCLFFTSSKSLLIDSCIFFHFVFKVFHHLTIIILNSFSGSLPSFMEKAMATHSSTLAWKFPWMEEPGRLQSMGS